MTTKDRIIEKLTSVTAMALLLMVCVLCALTFTADSAGWKDVFSSTLSALLGYYIGRNRPPPQTTNPKDTIG